MADTTWVGLYLPEDDGAPVALCRDGVHAHHLQMQVLNRPDAIRAPADGLGVHPAVREQFRAAAEAPAHASAEPSGIAALRGRVRTRLTEEALEAQIEAEERAAMGLPPREGALKVPAKTAEALGIGDADPEREPTPAKSKQ